LCGGAAPPRPAQRGVGHCVTFSVHGVPLSASLTRAGSQVGREWFKFKFCKQYC
jgi:hypothetical protein